ncbi:glycosyltransferase family 1 protein [Pandoraea nosoerga]|uniref:glycosyltransferase n=1 Tax=Pandoraea nosoerga TaxID=2508296 RepID=UPI00197F18AD|nr:glycosyltransferase [Pandoraea nosoerga]MBN4666577.1 glycosyltransferase family 1 protein [Pandoraea nosoerga]MBN4674179.1 glycosyltransferase family 1 protein [Pandoraea nosoerga]MBN4679887.1 glycosyltransferase family 1 protein [Pandoraea nosoerga]MBN4744398.1 glycosyltransferase family 1 protein [Pandoraea nosoerga]
MSDPQEHVVWLPLRPGSSWRGEGIAQTVENILTHAPADSRFCVVVSKDHAPDLRKVLEKHPNVRVHPIGFGKRKRSVEITLSSQDSPSLIEIAATKFRLPRFHSFSVRWELAKYSLSLYWHYFLQRRGWFLPGRTVYWFPTPIIPGTERIKAKKVCSFWDPFVFEYREFAGIAPILLRKFRSHFEDATWISTQSEANQDYLTRVLKMNPAKITVLHNGSPSYAQFLPKLQAIGKRNAAGLLDAWSPEKYSGESRSAARLQLAKDLVNKSVLWRLLQKVQRPRDKILMVSTQLRPYKGFGALLELMNYLVSNEAEYQYHFVFTAEVPVEAKEQYPILYERIHEIIRVPAFQHAALYYIADLVLHPSFVEGGLGVYPQFEAASVGTPTLVNIGRHALEQTSDQTPPPHTSAVFTDVRATAKKIEALMASEALREANLRETRDLVVEWSESSQQYANMFDRLANVE